MTVKEINAELHTIYINLALGLSASDWGIIDRATQRLAELTMSLNEHSKLA
jgi:hypothetical protein